MSPHHPGLPTIRLLTASDASDFRQFRLGALTESPEAFEETADELQSTPVDVTAARLAASTDANFVIGAFLDGRLVGTVGFFRSERRRTSARSTAF